MHEKRKLQTSMPDELRSKNPQKNWQIKFTNTLKGSNKNGPTLASM